MIKIMNILRLLNVAILIWLIILCVKENKKIAYFSEYKVRRCVVVAKDIRQYNATPASRTFDLRYKNVFICNSDGAVFEVTVSDELYYNINIGETVYFNLTMYDMYDSMPEKKWGIITYSANLPFILLVFSSIASLCAFFYLKTWNIFNTLYN